ncbi:MAG TPA: PfkB family carbohydrate kinase [Fodinibius sp.]|nr:PfkB family carbohydrate kinase [Fodinibius sp.]
MILTVCANPSVDSFWSVGQIQQGTTNRSEKESFYPGGKGIHTALALAELGQQVTTLGLWGGQTGQWLQNECNQRNIETIGPVVDDWSRLCITMRSDTNWNETELLGGGPTADPNTLLNFNQAYTRCLQTNQPEAILISGSVPSGFNDQSYAKLVAEGKQHNVPVFVDASGNLMKNTLEARPYGIHINHKEGRELSGREDPIAIADWLSDYCTLTAVTAGADGLYLKYRDAVYHASHALDQDRIFSTIGSGDCLLAGLALAVLQKKDAQDWARFATACGSANCIHPQLGMLKASIVEELIDEVKVEKL